MSPLDLLTIQLQQAGMRITPQRMAICKLLLETKTHPTALEVYEQVRVTYPSLSLMTVYNTLNTLVEIGAINELGRAGDTNTHYDGDTSPHINLACVACHKIVDITSQTVDRLNREVSDASGYALLGARVLYYGVCGDCQTKNGATQ